jgi:two-component system phosphate regulon sensor histidine kinase PhoR
VKLGIRLKLFLVSVGLIALATALGYPYVTSRVEAELTRALRDELSARASLVARDVATSDATLDDVAAWDAIADSLGASAAARVTLVRTDGVVLGDSEVPTSGVRSMENHGAREEVAQALAGGRGFAVRRSATLGYPSLYVAVPLTRGGLVIGAVRLSEPLETVGLAVGSVQRLVSLAAMISLVVAGIMSSFAAQSMSRIVRDLTDLTRRMTRGDLGVRSHFLGDDELGDLGRALDQLAGSLATSLGELRAERDLQSRILDGMKEGVLVLDQDDRILLMNPALREMLLLGASDVGKLLIESVRHAELHDVVERARARSATITGELDLPGIKPRRLLIHATALAGEAGGVLAVFVDVTDLRRLESIRRDFVANVSHELRTPVTAVRSAAETLRDSALKDPDPKAAERFADIIVRNSERLQNLIEDLLELSRLESKEFKLKKERIDLPVVASLVMALFRERAERKGIQLLTEIPSGTPTVETDQRALEQVLSNLVDNAVKYCPSGASVKLRASNGGADGMIRLSVEDTGPGISEAHQPRLFERFYRVDAGRSRDVGGTGLGLSIVKHMVEAMGGEVTVRSAVGKGSTFEVRLPLVPKAPRSSA